MRRIVAAVMLGSGLAGVGAPLAAQMELPAPVGLRVPLPPSPIAAMGHTYLAYELHLSSFAPVDLTLARLEVYLDGDTKPVATFRGPELAAMRLDPSGKAGAAGVLQGGGFDVLFIWLELGPAARPSSVRNVVVVAAGGGEAQVDNRIEVRPASEIPVLGPPLRGGPWVMAHGPANPNGHRRSYVTIGGRAAVVQRYGIDYFKVDTAGHIFAGDTAKTQDYHGYGQDVLAVADGLVAVTHDGVAENQTSPFKHAVPINLGTIGGNYVMLDIGKGKYVFYAHLKPGSLRVKRGDRVRRGQVLGLLGLSGNTPAPHLHLHVGDTTEPLGSEGQPYLYDAFDVVGECPGPPEMWGWYKQCSFGKPDPRRGEMPLAWKLIRFKD